MRRLSVFPAVLAVMLVLGAWRADSVSGPLLPLASKGAATVAVEGRISSDPETAGSRAEFTLDLGAADSTGGRILVYAPPIQRPGRPPLSALLRFRRLHYCHRTATGTLRTPEPFGGFDYPAYLASQGITEIMPADTAEVIGESGGWREWPYAIRGRLSESIEDTIPYPQSALGQALLLGLKGDLPPQMVEDFRGTGTSHLLAISGLHVGVLVVMFLTASSWLFGRRGFCFLAVPLLRSGPTP